MSIKRQEVGSLHSRIVEHNGVVYLAGATADNRAVPIKEQTEQVLAKIDRFLAMAGTGKSRLLTATIYIANWEDRDAMNEVWRSWIDPEHPPARLCVRAGLAPGALIEIMVSAAR